MVKKRFNRITTLANQKEAKSDQWNVVQFPAIMDHGTEKAEPVWPEYWKMDELEKVQGTLPVAKWNSRWMQNQLQKKLLKPSDFKT